MIFAELDFNKIELLKTQQNQTMSISKFAHAEALVSAVRVAEHLQSPKLGNGLERRCLVVSGNVQKVLRRGPDLDWEVISVLKAF